jgi:hypothetical protein
MNVLLGENMSDPRLAARLRARRHGLTFAADVGSLSATDPRVLIRSIDENIPD